MTPQNKINLAILGAIIILGYGAFYTPDAEADPYIGTSVFTLDTDVGDFRGIDLNAGYRAGEILEVRAHYMLGAEDESVDGVKVELDQMYGVDVIVNIPLSDTLNPYVLAGNTWVKAKGSYGGYSISEKDDFVTFGAGVRFDVREAVSVYFEYKDVDGTDSLGLGFTSNF